MVPLPGQKSDVGLLGNAAVHAHIVVSAQAFALADAVA